MCNCIDRVNQELADNGINTKITTPMIWSEHEVIPTKTIVATEKTDKKKRGNLIKLYASFCPFCGEKYPETK